MGYVSEILKGAWSLVVGFSVTVKRLFRPVITVQYPRQRIVMHDAYRGHIQLKPAETTAGHSCVACGTCVRECPSGLIRVQGVKDHARSAKRTTHYIIDFTKCSLCGLCVDACPVGAIEFSMDYDLAGRSRWDGVIDLVEELGKARAKEAA